MAMKYSKFAQISFFEFVLIFLLFGFLFTSSIYDSKTIDKDHKIGVDSFLDSIYYSEDFRNLTFDENLSASALSEDWTQVQLLLDNSFNNYELILSNSSDSKHIFSCDAKYNKYYSERIISIKNNTRFEFRQLRLGVCY